MCKCITIWGIYVSCTLYIVQCTLYIVHCTFYILHCKFYIVHFTLYTAQLYTVHVIVQEEDICNGERFFCGDNSRSRDFCFCSDPLNNIHWIYNSVMFRENHLWMISLIPEGRHWSLYNCYSERTRYCALLCYCATVHVHSTHATYYTWRSILIIVAKVHAAYRAEKSQKIHRAPQKTKHFCGF